MASCDLLQAQEWKESGVRLRNIINTRVIDRRHIQKFQDPGPSKQSPNHHSNHDFTYVSRTSRPSSTLAQSLTSRATVQYELNPPPTDAISAVRFAPGNSTKLLVSSWDRNVYLYDVAHALSEGSNGESNGHIEGSLIRTFEHRAPVLDVCFGEDEDTAYSTGLDWDVRR